MKPLRYVELDARLRDVGVVVGGLAFDDLEREFFSGGVVRDEEDRAARARSELFDDAIFEFGETGLERRLRHNLPQILSKEPGFARVHPAGNEPGETACVSTSRDDSTRYRTTSGAGNPRVAGRRLWGIAFESARRFPTRLGERSPSALKPEVNRRIASRANIRLAFDVGDARINDEENVAFAIFDLRLSFLRRPMMSMNLSSHAVSSLILVLH